MGSLRALDGGQVLVVEGDQGEEVAVDEAQPRALLLCELCV